MTKKILMIVGDYVEDYEVMVPFQALQMLGHTVHVVCPDKDEDDCVITAIHDFEDDEQTYSEKRGHMFKLNASMDDIEPSDYDGLIIPGGRAPEYIRLYDEVIEIVHHFDEEKKPIAAICHGPLVLIAAGILNGRECAGYETIGPDITNAGAEWIDIELDEVHVEGNLVTAPAWPANPEWLSAFLELLEEGEEDEKDPENPEKENVDEY